MKSLALLFLVHQFATLSWAQAPPPTQGVPYLRLLWARVADLNGELGSVECAEFSADGQLIATATKYGNDISVWRVADGARMWSVKAEQEVERVAFSPDSKVLAAGGEDDLLRLFNASDGKPIATLKHTSGIDSLRWSGRWDSLGDRRRRRARAPVADARSQASGQILVGGAINELDFTQDGKWLVAAGNTTGLRILSTTEMKVAKVIHRNNTAPPTTTRFSPDGTLVAAGGHNGIVDVWRVADGEPVQRINFTGQKVESLTFGPDGLFLLYAGHDPHIRVRISDWALVHQSMPVDNAEYLAFSKNGSFLVSAHQDGAVRLWVWMRGDQTLNKRLHNQLMKKQAEEDGRTKNKPR